MRKKILVLAMLVTVAPALSGCAVGDAAVDTINFASAVPFAPLCLASTGKFDCM